MREAVRFGEGERGAVKIQTVVVLIAVAIVAFVLFKVTPVYVEQQKVIHDVDELARISAVRGYKDDKVSRELNKIAGDHGLPDNSITFNIKDRRVKIVVGYKRDIDFLVTNYTWQVNHEVEGTEL